MATAPISADSVRDELLAAGPTVPLWPTAGQAIGAQRTLTYGLAKRGEFPAKVLKLGGTYRVVTSSLLELLGIDRPESA